ncbi:MAG: uracil-DNA glycosylase family protein [Methanotrichaceae archaeon]
MNLDDLRSRIISCPLCRLCESRTNAVPGEGPKDARIMLIGEAPGAEEDRTGRPFVGRAGRLLDRLLAEAGIERSQVFITSAVKCRPPNNRKPKRDEMEICVRTYLRPQMGVINPRAVCLMGNVASFAVIGKQGVTSIRGQIFDGRFLITFHPAAVLRNMNLKDAFVSDLKAARNIAETEKP